MQDRNSAVKAVALGTGLALAIGGAILAAQQVGTGPAKGARQPDWGDPCCAITNIDAKASVITAKVTATGQMFRLDDIPSGSIGAFKVGAALDLECAVPPNSGPTGASGNAATSGTPTTTVKLPWVSSTGCGTTGPGSGAGTTGGTNVPRDSRTTATQPPSRPRPAGDCHVKTGSGAPVAVACPAGIPIKVTK